VARDRDVLNHGRSDDFARTTPGCETIKDNDFVIFESGFEGIATIKNVSICLSQTFPHLLYPFPAIPCPTTSNQRAEKIHIRAQIMDTHFASTLTKSLSELSVYR
jgi:hypothetical protein